jgi:hypothetical protein
MTLFFPLYLMRCFLQSSFLFHTTDKTPITLPP